MINQINLTKKTKTAIIRCNEPAMFKTNLTLPEFFAIRLYYNELFIL